MQRKIALLTVLVLMSLSLSAQSYQEENIEISMSYGTLGGVLTYPSGVKKMPAVLIIQGSGPTDKDGNSAMLQGKNNSLKLLAESLAKQGIASLRYDKRGMGMSAQAKVVEAELSFEDFVQDAEQFLQYLLADKRFKRIGVAGHSQGSLIGMLISQKLPVDAFASIAGPSFSIDETLMAQFKANPYNPPRLLEEAETILSSLKKGVPKDTVSPFLQNIFRPSIQPFMMSWMKYDPTDEISKLKMPILVINGSTDLQVGVEDAQRLHISNDKSQLVIIKGMNHVLKDATANPVENNATYGNPNLLLNQQFEQEITSFFIQQLKK